MKQNFTYYMICLWAMLAASACTDDWAMQRNNVIQEGIPVTISLDFGVSASKVVTRAAQSDEAEQTINRLYLFAFNSDGSLDSRQLYSDAELVTIDDCLGLTFSMHSGYNKKFYAIGNPVSGSGTLTTDVLARIQTENELLSLTSSLINPINIERSYFLMSGKMETTTIGGQINVTETGEIQGAIGCDTHKKPVIELERVDARITFKIKGVTSNSNYQDFTFVPDRYWVENIPQHTYVFPHDEDYVSTEEGIANYASMSEEGENGVQVYVEGQNDGYYYFDFYLPENRLIPRQRIESGDAARLNTESLYALREKKDKTLLTSEELAENNKNGQTESNGAFTYANTNSTYVVFHGTLSYTDVSNGQQFVYADATYTVHLGETGTANDANNVDKVNNYNTRRNTHYTYTVEVTGVESMRVEVEGDREERRPGIEGDLIYSGEAVAEMDAHYGRTQFTLTRGAIKQGLSWAIRTPFQSGMKPFDDTYKAIFETVNGKISTNETDYTEANWKKLQTDLNLNDYKWVQFLINKEAGFNNDQFAKYPGYASYVGENYVDDIIDEPAPPFGGSGAVPPSSNNHYNNNQTVKLYDVNQLLNHLYVEAMNDETTNGIFTRVSGSNRDEDYVTITAFVDEYVYVYDPTKIYYRTPQVVTNSQVGTGVDLTLWRKVVNRDNRMLYLCTTGAIYSNDGETSVSRNVFTIAQRPVYTFYNANDPDVINGWGTESINETGPLGVTTSRSFTEKNGRENTTSNGLINTWNVLNTTWGGELTWDEIMTLGDRDPNNDGIFSLNDGYDDIWHACIARNRDLDGDNVVDETEVRWYLASIDQLTDLWIGESSLNESARLYTWDYRDETNGIIRSHVASSSYNTGYTNPWKIWAEEGASRGPYNKSDEDVNGTYTKTGKLIPYNDWLTYGSHVNPWREEPWNQDRLGLIHYRCVRNLGISLQDPDSPFDPYVTVSDGSYTNENGETYNELVLSMERMEANSVRSAIYRDAELPEHTERKAVNRPYSKFAVIINNGYDSNGTENGNSAQNWKYYQEHNVCPQGYRMPNQRELMLMYIYIPQSDYASRMSWIGDGRQYMSGTGFEFKSYYSGTREGFIYQTSNNGVLFLNHGDGDTGYVRCVRDVPE